MEKELPNTNVHRGTTSKRDTLARCGIYAACYDWANHKKSMGEIIASRFHNHKQFLRKHHLGKFAKR